MRDIRICFVGDSFVNGTGDRSFLGWTGRICQSVDQSDLYLTHYNLGVRRETSTDIRHRWQQEVSCRIPDTCEGLVVFSFGANDTTMEQGATRVSVEDSIYNADTILSVAKLCYSVLMVSPAPVGDREQCDRIASLSQQFKTVCEQSEIPYLDVFTPLSQSTVWLAEAEAGDGAHPDAGGYAEYAELVQNWSAWKDWF